MNFSESFVNGIGNASGSLLVFGVVGALWYVLTLRQHTSLGGQTKSTGQQTNEEDLSYKALFDKL